MALVTVNGTGVISGCLAFPRIGAWGADLKIDTETPPAGAVTLVMGGTLTLKATVQRAAVYQGVVDARFVAGGDGLRKTAPAKHYTSPLLRLPLEDMLRAAGETLSPTSELAVLRHQLQSWTTLARPTGVEIADLLGTLSTPPAWRFLPDGTLWVGAETWPDSGIRDFRAVDESPAQGFSDIGLDAPTLLPGTTLDGRKVDLLEIVVDSGRLLTRVWWSP